MVVAGGAVPLEIRVVPAQLPYPVPAVIGGVTAPAVASPRTVPAAIIAAAATRLVRDAIGGVPAPETGRETDAHPVEGAEREAGGDVREGLPGDPG